LKKVIEKDMEPLISFQNVFKKFGKASVLNNISFDIKKGEIFGLLGVNGAGKTTLIRCLLGLLRTTSGETFFKGAPLTAQVIQEHFGFLPENFFPPRHLKGREFLQVLGWGLNVSPEKVEDLLGLVGLQEHGEKLIKTYSRGMIQRLGLCCALLKSPQVMVLDEATLGLDPLGQRDVLNLMVRLNREGKTIFFSSHILSQIEAVCTRIGILHAGGMRFIGRVGELMDKHQIPQLEEAFLKEIDMT